MECNIREEITDFGKVYYINTDTFRFALHYYNDDLSAVYLTSVFVDEKYRGRGLGNLIFGFLIRDNYERQDIIAWEELQNRFQCKDKKNKNWIWKYFDGYTNWNDKNVIKDLLDDNSKTLSDFSTMIDFAMECAKGLEL